MKGKNVSIFEREFLPISTPHLSFLLFTPPSPLTPPQGNTP